MEKDDAYYNQLADQCRTLATPDEVDRLFAEHLYEPILKFLKKISRSNYQDDDNTIDTTIVRVWMALRNGLYSNTKGNFFAWVRTIYDNEKKWTEKKNNQRYSRIKYATELSTQNDDNPFSLLENSPDSCSFYKMLSPSEFIELVPQLREEMDAFKKWYSNKKCRGNFTPAEVWVQLRRIAIRLIPAFEYYTNRGGDMSTVPELVPWQSDEEKWTFRKLWPNIAQIWNQMEVTFLSFLTEREGLSDHPTASDLDNLLLKMIKYNGSNWENSRSTQRKRTRNIIEDYTKEESPPHTLFYQLFIGPSGKGF